MTEFPVPPIPDFDDPHHQAIFWRGVFIQAYAGFEHAVTELLLRASNAPTYRKLGAVPFRWSEKLKRLQGIIEVPGGVAPFGPEILALLKPFTAFERYRHTLAHGILHFGYDADGPVLTFKTHDHVGKRGLHEWLFVISLAEFKGMSLDLTGQSNAFATLMGRIFEAARLEQVPMAERQLYEPSPREFRI